MARHKNLTKLKIKIKHLALEPAIIRKEERKLLKEAKWYRQQQETKEAERILWDYKDLLSHRKHSLKPEARAAQLAYAFLRGKPYASVEKPRDYEILKHTPLPFVARAIQLAHKYRVGKYIGMSKTLVAATTFFMPANYRLYSC